MLKYVSDRMLTGVQSDPLDFCITLHNQSPALWLLLALRSCRRGTLLLDLHDIGDILVVILFPR